MSRLDDNDWFFDRFDRHEKRLDNMLDNPGKTFLKVGIVAVLLNLLFWGAVIAVIVLGLSLIL